MAEKFAVGVDFGGTKILAGVVNLSNGRLVSTGKKKTRQVYDTDDVIARIAAVVDEAIESAGVERKKLAGIGIGAAGMVNRQRGVIMNAVNLGLEELPLTEPLSNHYRLPCRLGNDVEVATLGEKRFGAGKGCQDFVCIFVGTGIGSGIVADSKLYRGSGGTAGEVGHIVVLPNGRPCGCGAFGCLEAHASRTAIAKQVLAEVERGVTTLVADKIDPTKGILRSRTLAQAVDANDEVVVRAVSEAARYMGWGLATVINMINPRRIILGGGLVEAVPLYFDLAVKEARYKALRIATRKLDLVRAELGDYAGIVGAALLVEEPAP